jgi:hypothetical protein
MPLLEGTCQLPRVNPSRPVYSGLQPDPYAKKHLIVAEGDGASALIDLFSKANPSFAERATLLYVPNISAGHAVTDRLHPLGANLFHLHSDVPSLLQEYAQLLDEATMGTTIYVAGGEGFIGEVARLGNGYGISFDLLRTAQRGSPAKRVQCVHCKFIEEGVVTETVKCSRCNLRLFVRDHYSHRLNAFMGVCVDAEAPIAQSVLEPIP